MTTDDLWELQGDKIYWKPTGMPMYERGDISDWKSIFKKLNRLQNEREQLRKELWSMRRIKSNLNRIKRDIEDIEELNNGDVE